MRSFLTRAGPLALVVASLTAFASTATAAPGWSEPTALGQIAREGGFPEIAIAPDGEAIAAWEGGRPNGIEVSTRRPGGTWTAPLTLAKAREAEGPHIAVAAGKAVIVWGDSIHTRSGETAAIMAVTRLRGKGWGRPRDISAEPRPREEPEGREPAVAITRGGKAVVMWQAFGEGHSTTPFIRSATQAAKGTDWSAPVGLPGSIEGEAPAVGTTPAGEAVAIWGASYDEESGIEATSRPPRGPWKRAGRLGYPGSFPEPHLAITPTGEAIAAWTKGSFEGYAQVLQVASRKPGARWKVKTLSPKDHAEAPEIAIGPGGQATVVWVRSLAFGSQEVVASTHSPGGGWTEPTSLAGEGLQLPAGVHPRIAMTAAGEAIAVWAIGGATGQATTVQASSKPPGQPWGAPTEILGSTAPPAFTAADIQVAVTPGGEALAVWRSYDGTGWVIEAAARPAAGST